MAERRLFGRCHSPRLRGWLCEVSLRATSSAAAPRVGAKRRLRRLRKGVQRIGRRERRGRGADCVKGKRMILAGWLARWAGLA